MKRLSNVKSKYVLFAINTWNRLISSCFQITRSLRLKKPHTNNTELTSEIIQIRRRIGSITSLWASTNGLHRRQTLDLIHNFASIWLRFRKLAMDFIDDKDAPADNAARYFRAMRYWHALKLRCKMDGASTKLKAPSMNVIFVNRKPYMLYISFVELADIWTTCGEIGWHKNPILL